VTGREQACCGACGGRRLPRLRGTAVAAEGGSVAGIQLDRGPAHGQAGAAAPARPGPPPARRAALDPLAALWRGHRLFIVVAGLSLLPRALAVLAFRPALLTPDSFGYLIAAIHPRPGQTRPAGYSVLLWLLSPFHSLPLVTSVQHLLGVATAAIGYAVLRRWGLPGWGATLATAPTLFGSRQIMMESTIWPDSLYGLLGMAAVALLLTRRTPAVWRAAAAGLLLAWCAVVRGNGPVLIAPVLAYLLVRRAGWRAAAVTAVAFAVPLAGYMTVFWARTGTFGTTASDGFFLWSRTMSFANCAVIKPPARLRPLCPDRQPGYRRRPAPAWSVSALLDEPTPAHWLWQKGAWWRHDARPGINPANNALAMHFALRAIAAQPGAYLAAVARDVTLTFLATDRATSFRTMHFTAQPDVPVMFRSYRRDLRLYGHVSTGTHPVQPYAYFLELYQLPVWFPGIEFGLVLAAGMAGVARRWRYWGGPGALPWAAAVLGVVFPVAVHEYHYRYAITAVPLACLAAGLAWSRAGVTDQAGAGERERGGQAGGRHHGQQVPVAEAGDGHRQDEQGHGGCPGQQAGPAPVPPAPG
jgi:hypothetical protein